MSKSKKAAPAKVKKTESKADPVETNPLPLACLADLYLGHLEQRGAGRGTVFSYSMDLNLALAHFGKERAAASITQADVEAYFASDRVTKTRTGKPKAKPTVDKTRRVLRLAMVWAAAEGFIPAAPMPE